MQAERRMKSLEVQMMIAALAIIILGISLFSLGMHVDRLKDCPCAETLPEVAPTTAGRWR